MIYLTTLYFSYPEKVNAFSLNSNQPGNKINPLDIDCCNSTHDPLPIIFL